MAENETLDLWDRNSARWRRLRDLVCAGCSVEKAAAEAYRNLVTTINKLQAGFEEQNKTPLKVVIAATCGEDGDIDEIVRSSRFGRDYLQLFQLQSGQGLDAQTVVEDVLTLTLDKFLEKIGQSDGVVGSEHFPDFQQYQRFRFSLKEQMIDKVQRLAKHLAEKPDSSVRMPRRSIDEKQHQQDQLLGMSLLAENDADYRVSFY